MGCVTVKPIMVRGRRVDSRFGWRARPFGRRRRRRSHGPVDRPALDEAEGRPRQSVHTRAKRSFHDTRPIRRKSRPKLSPATATGVRIVQAAGRAGVVLLSFLCMCVFGPKWASQFSVGGSSRGTGAWGKFQLWTRAPQPRSRLRVDFPLFPLFEEDSGTATPPFVQERRRQARGDRRREASRTWAGRWSACPKGSRGRHGAATPAPVRSKRDPICMFE